MRRRPSVKMDDRLRYKQVVVEHKAACLQLFECPESTGVVPCTGLLVWCRCRQDDRIAVAVHIDSVGNQRFVVNIVHGAFYTLQTLG